ncbi:MAG: hypothetical protein AB1899_13715 [Pseudomonadota bacterium]
MKSLVLLTFFALNPGEPVKNGPTEFFDNQQSCQTRMQELRASQTRPGSLRCACHETVVEVEAEGNDAL